jgi:HD superfamily phosphohydrolase
MKWIEPGNGGEGAVFDFGICDGFVRQQKRDIYFTRDGKGFMLWKYPDEQSREADFNRLRAMVNVGEEFIRVEKDPMDEFHAMVLTRIGKEIKVFYHPRTKIPSMVFENETLEKAFNEITRFDSARKGRIDN